MINTMKNLNICFLCLVVFQVKTEGKKNLNQKKENYISLLKKQQRFFFLNEVCHIATIHVMVRKLINGIGILWVCMCPSHRAPTGMYAKRHV